MTRLLSFPLLGLLTLAIPVSAQQAQIPSAVVEKKLEASVEGGYRWVKDISGNQEVYRSIVNLNEGPRLFGAQAQWRDPGNKYVDRMDLIANSWGDPYNTARLEVDRSDQYSLLLNYRNVAYFNSLPSFANPLLGEGVLQSQRTFDTKRRQLDTELRIKPNSKISPFFSYLYSDGTGLGRTTFVSFGNEFPVSTDLDDTLNSFRGGVRLKFAKYNFTFEQGYTKFDDDQRIFFDDGGNRGNRRTNFLGQEILLDELSQRYTAEGEGIFNRGVVQGRPTDWLNFSGQILYSQPEIDVAYEAGALGNFLFPGTISPFTSQFEQSVGDANRPRTSGSWNTEFRLGERLRVVQSWWTDRFHVAAGSVLGVNLDTTPETETETVFNDLLVLNYNQNQVDVIFDVNQTVSLRGGYRYVWGDSVVREAPLRLSPNAAEVRRHVGLAGARLRFGPKFSLNMDFEGSPGDKSFFRTSLMKYQKGSVRGRYRLNPSLTISGAFAILNNQNKQTDVQLDQFSQRTSLIIFWAPNGGSRFNLTADYTRSTYRSDIPIVVPPFFDLRNSRYRDKANLGSVFAEVGFARNIRLNFGGTLAVIGGSQPTQYYQPRGRVSVPIIDRFAWTAEWRWYGFRERLLPDENFNTHVFSTGVRLSL